MSGQAEQELGKRLGGKDEREFGKNMGQEVEGEVTGKIGRWEVGGTQDIGRYVYLVREDRKENDVGEEKDVGKKVDTCHEIAGVVFQQEVGECFECNEGWEYDQTVGSMKAGQAQYIGSQVDLVAEQEVDVEEGGGTLEDERGRRVGGMKKVGRYSGDDVDSGVEDNDEEKNDVEDIENAEDVDVDAGG